MARFFQPPAQQRSCVLTAARQVMERQYEETHNRIGITRAIGVACSTTWLRMLRKAERTASGWVMLFSTGEGITEPAGRGSARIQSVDQGIERRAEQGLGLADNRDADNSRRRVAGVQEVLQGNEAARRRFRRSTTPARWPRWEPPRSPIPHPSSVASSSSPLAPGLVQLFVGLLAGWTCAREPRVYPERPRTERKVVQSEVL